MVDRPLGLEPARDPSARVVDCRLGHYTEVGARTRLTETILDDYSYIGQDCEVIYTTIGKFCSIAASVRINPGNHPMERASQAHFTYRARAYWPEESDEPAFFDRRRASPVAIGHDVWIGHGVVVLPGRTIGTGAVVGAIESMRDVTERRVAENALRRAHDNLEHLIEKRTAQLAEAKPPSSKALTKRVTEQGRAVAR